MKAIDILKTWALILLSISPTIAISETLELDCRYKYAGKVYKDFLKKSKNDTNTVAQQLKPLSGKDYDAKILYVIDLQNKQIISPWPDVSKVTIHPDLISIVEYMTCKDDQQFPKLKACMDEVIKVYINRLDGTLTGEKHAGDNSWEPYFKKGDLMYYIQGKCRKLEKEF